MEVQTLPIAARRLVITKGTPRLTPRRSEFNSASVSTLFTQVRKFRGSSTNELRGDICALNVLALIDDVVLRLSLKGSRISAWGKRIRECG